MAQLFPKWANKLPLIVGAGGILPGILIIGLFWYYGSPKYTDVGYRPVQPVAYSHKLHAGDMGMDCRYCHTGVEYSAVAGVPPTQTCMNCHQLVKPTSDLMKQVIKSWESGTPIQWVRVHKTPDYAYFNHSIHVNAGVGCETCHGNVQQMEVVQQMQTLSMSWCVDCHRNPDPYLRPLTAITTMNWMPPTNQAEIGAQFRTERNINPPTDCTGCHR